MSSVQFKDGVVAKKRKRNACRLDEDDNAGGALGGFCESLPG